jgi:multidrug transporter EmrE-like cation transporter
MNYIPIAFASLLAAVDISALGIVKEITLKGLNPYFLAMSMIIYSMQPLILWNSLSYQSLTVMNVLWNIISTSSIAIMGLLYFKEHVAHRELIGIVLSLACIYLFSFTNKNDPILRLFS